MKTKLSVLLIGLFSALLLSLLGCDDNRYRSNRSRDELVVERLALLESPRWPSDHGFASNRVYFEVTTSPGNTCKVESNIDQIDAIYNEEATERGGTLIQFVRLRFLPISGSYIATEQDVRILVSNKEDVERWRAKISEELAGLRSKYAPRDVSPTDATNK